MIKSTIIAAIATILINGIICAFVKTRLEEIGLDVADLAGFGFAYPLVFFLLRLSWLIVFLFSLLLFALYSTPTDTKLLKISIILIWSLIGLSFIAILAEVHFCTHLQAIRNPEKNKITNGNKENKD